MNKKPAMAVNNNMKSVNKWRRFKHKSFGRLGLAWMEMILPIRLKKSNATIHG
ncbi:MAG TPA: hypothetical protein PLI09_11495 [Candidatus Hydrogenedentes bacterium]|nr:hypothetical protein [Candidatus Hydrogenedentota bacterium]